MDVIEFIQTLTGTLNGDEIVAITISLTSASESELQNINTVITLIKEKKCPLAVIVGLLRRRL